jgi:hypothetical protein
MHRKLILLGMTLLGAALLLAACGGGETPAVTSEAPPMEPEVVIPFLDEWMGSGHADASAEAFTHWDEDDPAEVPAGCAKCHSEAGYRDFLGVDGTAAGTVDNAAPIGGVVTCITCHNSATAAMTSVVFPSGVEVTGLGDESRCMQCHQGRESTVSVNTAIASVSDMDTPSADLRFINIHYFAAGATQYGGVVQGGYQYDEQTYDAQFRHAGDLNTCISCHSPHTLELQLETCASCHTGVASVEDLRNIRMAGSLADYDGDGNSEEGMYYELEGLRGMLYQAMQAYASEVAGTAIAYSSTAYPYFFIDTNGNGTADPDEANSDNGFNAWTGRLVQAAYNYQTSLKDPGAYAHGGKYIIQLMYDSIADLNTVLSTPIDLSTAHRIDPGHFAGSEEAFRHWDEDEGVVSGRCARCHTAEGLPFYMAEGVNVSTPAANGLECSTCHNDLSSFTRYAVEEVTFPSGAQVSLPNADANLCLQCHQGRESTVSVNRAIGNAADDAVTDGLSFRNVHYFAGGATLFGSEVQGGYQYAGQEYVGRNAHVQGFDVCTACHNTHALEVEYQSCATCHPVVEGVEDLGLIRGPTSTVDFDGDGDTTEGIAGEVETMREALYAAIQAYAADTVGTPIVYEPAENPYFFTDANANGQYDEDEAGYATWTPRLLRAAYNYQYVTKDPGAFAHNSRYILQLLYDSLADLGATTGTRP